MKKSMADMITKLEGKIQSAYEEGVTMDQAEKLAAEFLYTQMQISTALRQTDLDARMRKTGLKAIKATVYMETVAGADRKPTEGTITATIDKHEVVQREQDGFDTAEVERAELERLYDVFGAGHVYFRQIARGNLG